VQNGVYAKVKLSRGLPETRVRLGKPSTVCSGPERIFHDGDQFVGTLLPIPPSEPGVTDNEMIRSAPDRMDGSTTATARYCREAESTAMVANRTARTSTDLYEERQ
jgi:hypothetical protein